MAKNRMKARTIAAALGTVLFVAITWTLFAVGGPTSGFGANGRAWFDDEFWMDVLIQGVGWLLVVASIGVTGLIFYRQRQSAIEDRRQAVSDRRDDERRQVQREARLRYVEAIDPLLDDLMLVTDETLDCLAELVSATRGGNQQEIDVARVSFVEKQRRASNMRMELLRRGITLSPDVEMRDVRFQKIFNRFDAFADLMKTWGEKPDQVTSEVGEDLREKSNELEIKRLEFRIVLNQWWIGD